MIARPRKSGTAEVMTEPELVLNHQTEADQRLKRRNKDKDSDYYSRLNLQEARTSKLL